MGIGYAELTETEKKIVRALAKKGTMTYYEVYKKEKLCSSSTAWELIKKLEKNGCVEVKKVEAFRIRGRKKKHYGLTLRGVSVALRQRESWEHIDGIAKQQEALLPLIFGKWRHFKEYVDDKELTDSLTDVLLLFFPMLELRAEEFGWKESALATLVMQEFCSYILKTRPEERIRWLKAIHTDAELRRWMIGIEKQYKMLFHAYDLSFDLIRQKEPNWDKAFEELRSLIRVPVSEEMEEKS